MKWLCLLSILALLSAEASIKQTSNVKTTKAKMLKTAKKMRSYGHVKADEARVADVSPRYTGYIETIYADALYKKVNKGEILATLYSPEVYRAKEDYINALKYHEIRANKTMMETSIDDLMFLNVNQSEVKKLKSDTTVFHLTSLYSPISGYIFEKNVHLGSGFGPRTKLFSVVNLDEVWVEVKIIQKDLSLVEHLEEFSVNADGVERSYEAKKEMLYPHLDAGEAVATLRLRVDNAGHKLFPGMYVTVDASAKEEMFLTLPASAVIRKGEKYYVFIVGDFKGEYEPREIKAENFDAQTYVVTEGLSEGDEVVSNALFMMDSDAQINRLY